MKPHAMLPDKSHDEQSRQDFVASLRAHLAARVMPGNTRNWRRQQAKTCPVLKRTSSGT